MFQGLLKKMVRGHIQMGKAIDIAISGKDAGVLYKIAKKYMTGIGISKRYIHMDSLTSEEAPRPTVWRYS